MRANQLPHIVRFRVDDETQEALERKVKRRQARDPDFTLSVYLRELIQRDLGYGAANQAVIDEEVRHTTRAMAGYAPEPNPYEDTQLPDPPPRPTKAPADWRTAQEPIGATNEGEPTYEAPHVAKGDGYCRAGCDMDADMACRWPTDHPDRPENRRRKRR